MAERLLKITLRRVNEDFEREMDFTYVNRLVVWNALGSSLASIFPFIDPSKISGFFSSSLTVYGALNEAELGNMCGICSTTSLCMPHKVEGCEHLFCYYCIANARDNMGEDKCPKCESVITDIIPL